ncbi:cytochrome P450 [Pseudofulvibacter geojedonensis]|uniref:Cytochrome P450 n=1 Tax=Pseudofulvibacter geojedonensis TaxID=1123758 RepID=A0ABW3I1L6_9FLAO
MKNTTLHKVSFFKVLLKTRGILKNPLPFHNENFTKHGDSFSISLGKGNPIIFTRDPIIAKYILQKNNKNYIKSELQTKYLAKYIGNGLLTASGNYWLQQRRLIQPAFHKKKLESLMSIMLSEIQKQLQKIPKNNSVDVFPIMNDLAFHVVAKSLFSYTDKGNKIQRLQEITETVQEMVVKELRQPFKKWWFQLNGSLKNTHLLSEESRKILLEIIEERRLAKSKPDDLLQMLLDSKYEDGTSMTNEQLIDEILILFVAGHETTSNALTFSFQLIAKNQEVQDKIREEVEVEVVDNEDILGSIQQLSFTKQCIEEAMRLYPPVYFIDRLSIEDDECNGVKIPKGTQVLMSVYEMHQHKQYWDNAQEFNPDRFHPDRKKEYSASYFPFGAGPRMCIGNNFAMYEMILTLAEIVKDYELEPVSKIDINPLITLKPKKAIIRFKSRK